MALLSSSTVSRSSPHGPGFDRDPFETYRPRLLRGLSIGAALALIAGITAAGIVGPVAPLELAGFWIAIALFLAAPVVLYATRSTLAGATLLIAGGAVSIFVPAYYGGGLRAPQVIWLLVIVMLAPIFFGSRLTLAAGIAGLAACSLLYALEIYGGLPAPAPEVADVSTYINLALATVFVMVASISTYRAMRRSSRELLALKEQVELRSEELAESESRKGAIIDSARAGLISADAHDRIIDFNPAASKILGYTREEAIGRTLAELIVPVSLRDAHRSAYRHALANPGKLLEPGPRELIALRSDGEEIPIEIVRQRIPVEGPAQFMAQIRDLRADRRKEAMVRRRDEQLRRAQRLEDVGRLAGGVAHDFNNLLMIIGGYSETIEEDPGASDSIRDKAREVSLAARQAASITRQLLAFSREQELTLTAVELERLLSEFEPTIRALLPPKIQLSTTLGPARWPVRANWTELERIVINLVMNAVDAMPEGGQLSLSTGYIEFSDSNSDRPPDLEPGSYARLQVADDGLGMNPEILSRAFEPFYTTKEVGKGTGLGLASVYGAVHQFGGHVDLESSPARGTRVNVYLPRAQGVAAQSRFGGSPEIAPTRPRTVLLAEDESAIRELIATRLRAEGHHVLEAADGEEALAFATLGEDEVELLISDVVMPKLSGTHLATELRARNPELPVLFISGFLGNAELDLRQRFPGAEFMGKPLVLDALLVTIGLLLDPEPEDARGAEDSKALEAPEAARHH